MRYLSFCGNVKRSLKQFDGFHLHSLLNAQQSRNDGCLTADSLSLLASPFSRACMVGLGNWGGLLDGGARHRALKLLDLCFVLQSA